MTPQTIKPEDGDRLSRREREIMDVIYSHGPCTVNDVVERMKNPPSYDSVRVTMGNLATKNILKRTRRGRQHVFAAVFRRRTLQRRAIKHLTQTFFTGSPTQAILALIDESADGMTDEELKSISEMIQQAKANRGGGQE